MIGSRQENKVCKKCGKSYNANIVQLESNVIDLSNGICWDCRKVNLDKISQQEHADTQKQLVSEQNKWRETCGIPMLYRYKSFKTFESNRKGNAKKLFDDCVKYAESFPLYYRGYIDKEHKPYPSMVILGERGIGKTHLVSAVAHRIIDRCNATNMICPIRMVSEPELLRKIQATFNYVGAEKAKHETEDEIMQSMMSCALLILDDVGKEPRQDMNFVQRTLFAIVNGRYTNMRPMILTSNKTISELETYLGADDATIDRLIEMCGEYKFFQATGESYRSKR